MPKKTTKKVNIAVTGKKQGYWVNEENLRKGERTIKAESGKALVKRYRSGYEYDKTITGYELTKENLELQFAQRRRVNPRAAAQDVSIRAKDTREAPIMTAKQFFDFTKRDIEGIDTPSGTQPSYRNMRGKVSQHPDRAYVGLMWKSNLGVVAGENIYAHWFLVEKVYQGGDKVDVIRHPDAKKFTLPFTDDSVKILIGDSTNDFVGIGEKRHKNEVKQFIKRHVGSGYLVADEKGNVIQPTGELLTKRGDPRVSYLIGVKKDEKPTTTKDGGDELLKYSDLLVTINEQISKNLKTLQNEKLTPAKQLATYRKLLHAYKTKRDALKETWKIQDQSSGKLDKDLISKRDYIRFNEKEKLDAEIDNLDKRVKEIQQGYHEDWSEETKRN